MAMFTTVDASRVRSTIKKGVTAECCFFNHFISLNTLSGYLGIKERKYLHTNYISVYLIKLLCIPGTQKWFS